MNPILAENKHGHGAVRDRIDTRDRRWTDRAGSVALIDWNKGYDVEEEVSKVIGKPFSLVTKDQGISYSCGGQSWGYYGEVLSTLFDKSYTKKSAKFIYAQTYVPGGGSAGRDNCNIAIKQGFADEMVLPSYPPTGTATEAFMERPQDITAPIRLNAMRDEALSYAFVVGDINTIATAIANNYGCIIGVVGQNNGTWESTMPQPPANNSQTWDHWLFAGKFKLINGQKFVGVKNSWGDSVGDHGWQWLSEAYFKTIIDGGNVIFNAWTLTFKPQAIIPKFIFTQQLGLWSWGTQVYNLQKRLIAEGYATFTIPTGFFGGLTQQAVKEYQTKHNIPATGYVGNLTLGSLNN